MVIYESQAGCKPNSSQASFNMNIFRWINCDSTNQSDLGNDIQTEMKQ